MPDDFVRDFPVADLPPDEQRRIADFLDAEISRLDTLAGARVRQRDLFQLRRARIVESELGLLEDSLQIRTVALKYRVRGITVGIVVRPSAWYVDSGGVPALRGVNVRPGHILVDDLVEISLEGHALHQKSRLHEGDVVVVRTGQAGGAAVIPRDFDGANCIDLVVIRPGPHVDPYYLEFLLNSDFAQRRVAEYSVGIIQTHFNVSAMKMLPMPAIDIVEQRCAVERARRLSQPIDELLSAIDKQMATLTERRRALITAAVAGQIDVTTAGRAAEWAATGR